MDAKRMIINISDQVDGFADEIAFAVKKIAKKYDFSEEFALSVIQTRIESMKVDVEHHKMLVMDMQTDAMNLLAESVSDLGECIKDAR